MAQYGKVSETYVAADLNCNSAYAFSHVLSTFSTRAVPITQHYQFYRLKSITWDLQPKYPLGLGTPSGAPAANNVGRPMRLYWFMNRQGLLDSGSLAASPLNWFVEQGCKPKPFGNSMSSSARIKYRPSLTDSINQLGPITPGVQTPMTAITPIFNKWINRFYSDPATAYDVDNDNVEWQGVMFYIDDYNNSGDTATAVAEVRITAVWEFKNPYTPNYNPGQSLESSSAIPLVSKVIHTKL